MSGTNASDSLFGWDFQINAAIVLMLEDIENIQKVRVEGQSEDIEITMTDGGCIFSQAKALANPSSTNNVKQKLSDGFGTLNQDALNPNVCKLVYITNAYNPLADKKSMPSFYGQSRKPYSALNDSGKKVVDGILCKGNCTNIDKAKLYIYTLPFENDMHDRYKVVIEKVKDFISSIKSAISGSAQEVLDIWQKQLFENATLHNTAIILTKKDIMWPLIVIMCDNERRGNPFIDDMDDGEYEEIMERYKSFISCKCQKFSFVTRVVGDFQSYPKTDETGNERVLAFITSKWSEYLDDFSSDTSEDDLTEALIKIILHQIIQQRRLINDVKKRVNLL
ncbi:hypothetical protein [Caproicibacter fermentans]|uniref:CD-NTase associated protein 4-like DNA endonuclease domain-containing protein n=1 Tax=Caproicibacter fermentans TaxID=2576756 RepID=A0A7G8T8L4_9FIRM|nr:hypothetical protein [Caproicibacter fermentans]QNK39955.1 hypothetical protein HCR03_14750 [Caproicibacter fermentans]